MKALPPKKYQKVKILNLSVSNLTLKELLGVLLAFSENKGVSIVNYANAHGCNLSVTHPEFCDAMLVADCIFCDGNGVKLGSKLLGTALKERMTPPDWIDEFFEQCQTLKKSLYFVGETEETITRFVGEVSGKYSGLKVCGAHHGFFDFGSDEEEALILDVEKSRPDYILTGMGMPKQEVWAKRIKKRLDTGVVLSTGALFLWYAGVEGRKQSFLTNTGFEWLVRYVRHPIRHFKRYVLGNPLFILRVLRQRIRRDLVGGTE